MALPFQATWLPVFWDVAGIVLNRNTIPGDKTAMFSSGIRSAPLDDAARSG